MSPKLHSLDVVPRAYLVGTQSPSVKREGAALGGGPQRPACGETRPGLTISTPPPPCVSRLVPGRAVRELEKHARDLSVSQREGGLAGGQPHGHPGWLSGGAGTAEWLLEGKTGGLWVAGRASGSGSQSRGAGSQGGDLASGHLALGSDSLSYLVLQRFALAFIQ